MAFVTLGSVSAGLGVNFSTLQVASLFNYDHFSYSFSGDQDTLFAFDDGANGTLFQGNNFTGSVSPTAITSITGGTVTTIVNEVNDINRIVVTNAAANAVTLWNAAKTNNTVAFINEVLKGADTIYGTAFADNFRGANGADTLNGLGGGDTLKGENGLDILRGGAGRDFLFGGANNDIFDFNAVSESGLTATTRDVVVDFEKGLDKLDFRNIASGDADGAFSLLARDVSVGHTGAVGTGKIGWYWEGQATATLADNKTILLLNNDADAQIEMTVELRGLINLSAVNATSATSTGDIFF